VKRLHNAVDKRGFGGVVHACQIGADCLAVRLRIALRFLDCLHQVTGVRVRYPAILATAIATCTPKQRHSNVQNTTVDTS